MSTDPSPTTPTPAAPSPADPSSDASPSAAPGGPAPLALTVVLARLEAADATEALEVLAAQLREAGAVTDDFPAALLERERIYPTGLPTPLPTAIPHADPGHVLRPGLALATLAAPVAFGEMGSAGSEVAVHLIAMPLLADAQEHLAALQALMALLNDEAAVAELLEAEDAATLRERAAARLAVLPTAGSAA